MLNKALKEHFFQLFDIYIEKALNLSSSSASSMHTFAKYDELL